jgi:hypothetical protein
MLHFKAMVAKDSIDKNQKIWKQLFENNKILEYKINRPLDSHQFRAELCQKPTFLRIFWILDLF